jgi:hypothetical protein
MERVWMVIVNAIQVSLEWTVRCERAPTIACMAFVRGFSASANKAGVVTHVLGICVILAAADMEDAKLMESAIARTDMMETNASISYPVLAPRFAVEEENAWKLSANAMSHTLERLVKSKSPASICVSQPFIHSEMFLRSPNAFSHLCIATSPTLRVRLVRQLSLIFCSD